MNLGSNLEVAERQKNRRSELGGSAHEVFELPDSNHFKIGVKSTIQFYDKDYVKPHDSDEVIITVTIWMLGHHFDCREENTKQPRECLNRDWCQEHRLFMKTTNNHKSLVSVAETR